MRPSSTATNLATHNGTKVVHRVGELGRVEDRTDGCVAFNLRHWYHVAPLGSIAVQLTLFNRWWLPFVVIR